MNVLSNGRRAIVDALSRAVAEYQKKTIGQTLLSRDEPEAETLTPIAAAIENTTEYSAVAGKAAFALNTIVNIDSALLARLALSRAEWQSPAESTDWLFRVLQTRRATIFLKAAIWGISLNGAAQLSRSATLLPFDQLPPSYNKKTLLERKKWQVSRFVWYSDRHFDLPLTAYVQEIKDAPFLDQLHLTFELIDEATQAATEICRLLEATCVGHPLAMAYWLEFRETELELAFTGNLLTWSLPEVHPRIEHVTHLDSEVIVRDYSHFGKLHRDWKDDLRRSMDRYTLSQCRRGLIDTVLDLALAFEIAVSQKGDNLPPRWKVSVRTAQLIGGPLDERKDIRRQVGKLYDLRNKATHGSALAGAERETVTACARIYVILLRQLLRFESRPDWPTIELEARSEA